MSGYKIIKPSISIGGIEFKCSSKSVSLEPGDFINYCEQEWTGSIDIELGYGATGSWNQLNAMRDSVETVILSPSDAAAGVETNPSATFDAVIPAIPFMSGATRGERQTITLELVAESEPVFAEDAS